MKNKFNIGDKVLFSWHDEPFMTFEVCGIEKDGDEIRYWIENKDESSSDIPEDSLFTATEKGALDLYESECSHIKKRYLLGLERLKDEQETNN